MLSILLFVGFAVGVAQEPRKDAAKKEEPKKETKLVIRCERSQPTYELEEPAEFFYLSNTTGEVLYRITDDGLATVKEGKLWVETGITYRFKAKAEKPCILRVELEQNGAKVLSVAAVGANKIEPGALAPADFDEFWRTQRQMLADTKIDSDLDFVAPYSGPLITTYRLTLGNVDGKKVQAWITVPKGQGQTFPVIISLPTAGVYPLEPDLEMAALGAITVQVSVHDLPLDAPRNVYADAAEKGLKSYWTKGLDDKTKNYFRHVILAGVRTIDYVSGRKDFNGEILITGSRQGGGLAAMIAGLDSRVTHLAADLPAFCDMQARSRSRLDSWPHWLTISPPEMKEKVQATSRYYDVCNFMPTFKGKSLWRVGLLDEICPARSIYAALERSPGTKEVIFTPPVAPTDPRWAAQWSTKRAEFIKTNLKLELPNGKTAPPPPPPPPPGIKR